MNSAGSTTLTARGRTWHFRLPILTCRKTCLKTQVRNAAHCILSKFRIELLELHDSGADKCPSSRYHHSWWLVYTLWLFFYVFWFTFNSLDRLRARDPRQVRQVSIDSGLSPAYGVRYHFDGVPWMIMKSREPFQWSNVIFSVNFWAQN